MPPLGCCLALLQVSLLCTLAAASPPQDPNLDLLRDCLDSLERALDFLANQSNDLNLDAVFALRAASDQLKLMTEEKSGAPPPALAARLRRLRVKADAAVAESVASVRISQPEYFRALGKLLLPGILDMSYPARWLGQGELLKSEGQAATPPDFFNEQMSDHCIHLLLGDADNPGAPCNVTRECWSMESSPGELGYTVTHSLLYLLFAEKEKCQVQLRRAGGPGPAELEALRQELCRRVLREAQDTQRRGFRFWARDLFMEQIFVCGLCGYRDFVRADWIRAVISWQESGGCFSFLHQAPTTAPADGPWRLLPEPLSVDDHPLPAWRERASRSKREDVQLADNCSGHQTAVALGALLISAKVLLQDQLAVGRPALLGGTAAHPRQTGPSRAAHVALL